MEIHLRSTYGLTNNLSIAQEIHMLTKQIQGILFALRFLSNKANITGLFTILILIKTIGTYDQSTINAMKVN